MFIKEVTIYQSEKIRVYINECYSPGRKTRIFAVRKDVEKVCAGRYLGSISWDGAWRQYVFCAEPNTKWSAGCKEEIAKFERMMTKKQRAKWKLKRSQNSDNSPNKKPICMFSVNGRCNSDYSQLDCNGIDIPDDCTYSQISEKMKENKK